MDMAQAIDVIEGFIYDELHNARVDRKDSVFLIALAEMIKHGCLQEQLANWNRGKELSYAEKNN